MTSLKTLPHIIRRLLKLTLWMIGVLFLLVVVLSGGLLWRLSTGPVSMPFLTPYLEAALASALGGRRIHVQNTILAWDVAANSLAVRARQVTIRQHDDTPLATIPTIDVKLSAGALLRGTVALTAINIEEVSGVLHRTPEGTFNFGEVSAAIPPPEQLTPEAAERSTAGQPSQVIADLVQNLAADPGGVAPLATLQALQVSKGTLVVHDQRLGATWHVPQFDLTLRRHQHGLTGTGRLTLADQVVTLRQLRAHGGALGLIAAGSIDIPASSVDVQGTIIPLYEVNTVLGKIPIVGDLVLGGKGQGLIAITAHVNG